MLAGVTTCKLSVALSPSLSASEEPVPEPIPADRGNAGAAAGTGTAPAPVLAPDEAGKGGETAWLGRAGGGGADALGLGTPAVAGAAAAELSAGGALARGLVGGHGDAAADESTPVASSSALPPLALASKPVTVSALPVTAAAVFAATTTPPSIITDTGGALPLPEPLEVLLASSNSAPLAAALGSSPEAVLVSAA